VSLPDSVNFASYLLVIIVKLLGRFAGFQDIYRKIYIIFLQDQWMRASTVINISPRKCFRTITYRYAISASQQDVMFVNCGTQWYGLLINSLFSTAKPLFFVQDRQLVRHSYAASWSTICFFLILECPNPE